MKIIVGIDDSTCSRKALEFVRQIPWPQDSLVIVVSALPELVPVYGESYVPEAPYFKQIMDEWFRDHRKWVSAAEQSLRDAGLRTEGKVQVGDPRIVLVDLARAENADLVVVGSHGRTGLSKWLLGSVAAHVVSHAPCSVTVVKTH